MKKQVLWSLSAFLLSSTAASGQAIYRSGTDTSGGQAVNCYTNSGAAQFRRSIVRSGGVIRNAQPKPADLGLSATVPAPKAYAYHESAYNPERRMLTSYVSEQDENGKTVRRPRLVDLGAIIDREAKKNGIDPLIVELIIQQESAFDPYAGSPAGAQGLMQLMPGTAAMLGVTDPFDIEQNVAGGTSYIAQQLKRFGSLDLALAAYNAGPGAVASCGGVPPYAETQNYVAVICGNYAQRRKTKSSRALGG
jgi:soluble lytic murein transglycosylase-like protein